MITISLNPYMVFQTWNHGKKRKREAILLLAYIADVSCLTNRSFYMRTLCLKSINIFEAIRNNWLVFIANIFPLYSLDVWRDQEICLHASTWRNDDVNRALSSHLSNSKILHIEDGDVNIVNYLPSPITGDCFKIAYLYIFKRMIARTCYEDCLEISDSG